MENPVIRKVMFLSSKIIVWSDFVSSTVWTMVESRG